MPTTPVGEVRLCSAINQACGIAYRTEHAGAIVAEGYAQIGGRVGV